MKNRAETQTSRFDSDLRELSVAAESFPEGLVRPIAFEAPDRLTNVTNWHGHIPFAFWIVEALRPRVLVELGTHQGDSYCAFAQAVDRMRLGTRCYAIDTWRGDEQTGFYGQEVFEDLRQYHDPRYGRFSRLTQSSFDDAAQGFPDGSVDLLHIDGLHTYDAVKHDFETWLGRLSRRAVVLFHDIDVRRANFGVWRLWEELAGEYPSFAFHHSNGLGVLAVGTEVAEPLRRLTGYNEEEANRVRVFFSRLGEGILARADAAAKNAASLRAEAKVTEFSKALQSQAREARASIDVLRAQAREAELALQAMKSEREASERQVVELTERSVRAERERDRAKAELQQKTAFLQPADDSILAMRREIDALWQSASWRLLRPLRNLARRVRRLDNETEPEPRSLAEALRTIIAIRQSVSWELTAPLRLARGVGSRGAPNTALVAKSARPAGNETELSAWEDLVNRGAILRRRGWTGAVGSSGKPKIFFSSHEASRTGAPLILLKLMQHFARTGLYELFVFCDAPGPILEAFTESAHVVLRFRHDFFANRPTINELVADLRDDPPRLAICNTALALRYSEAFATAGVPVVTLVHELSHRFTEDHFRRIYNSSRKVIFPAEFVRNDAHGTAPIPEGKAAIVSQGLLNPDFGTGDRQQARSSVRRELGIAPDKFIVLGCGTADTRKGLDLFVGLAHKILTRCPESIHFVWVGPETIHDTLALPFAKRDAKALGIADRVHFVGERPDPTAIFLAADVFVLTSRDDPFPSVVLEAMAAGAPVVVFQGAGGAPEALAGGCGVVVEYRNIEAMAEAVLKLYREPEEAVRLAASAKARVAEKYRFQDYYRRLVDLVEQELGVSLSDQRAAGGSALPRPVPKSAEQWRKFDFELIEGDPDFDLDFFLKPFKPGLSRDEAIRAFMNGWNTPYDSRRPCAGFNPQIYAAKAMNAEQSHRNPYAHFIEAGKPPGRWLTPLIVPPFPIVRASRLRTALQLHAYYPELIDDFLQRLAVNSSRCDLFVSTSDKEQLERLRVRLQSYDRGEVRLTLVPNRGRDLGPFLSEYNFLDGKYDLVGHLHTKKSVQLISHFGPEFGELWRNFLWRNLLGPDYPMIDVLAGKFEDDEALGLVFPDDPNVAGWYGNKEIASFFAKRMNINTDLPDAFEFPVGSMFWCRPQALRPLLELGLSWEDYPPEPVPIDGTMLHAIERLLPFVVENQGYNFSSTHIPGPSR